MKVFKTEEADEVFCHEDPEDDYDVPEGVFVACWHNYHNEGYGGWGEAIFLTKDGKWFRHNMGHCSCYGPMDGLDNYAHYTYAVDTLEQLKAEASKELNNDLEPVFALIKATRGEWE